MTIDHEAFERSVRKWKASFAHNLPDLTKDELCDAYLDLAARLEELKGRFRRVSEDGTKLWEQLEAAKKDAERYRWLRSEDAAVAEVCNEAIPKEDGFIFMVGEKLDAAIDAAMKKEGA